MPDKLEALRIAAIRRDEALDDELMAQAQLRRAREKVMERQRDYALALERVNDRAET